MTVQHIQCPCGASFPVDSGGLESFQCTCPTCHRQLQVGTAPPASSHSVSPSARPKASNQPVDEKPIIQCPCGFQFKVATREKNYQCRCPRCQKLIQVGQPRPTGNTEPGQPHQTAPEPALQNSVPDPLLSGDISRDIPQPVPGYTSPQQRPSPKKKKKKARPAPDENPQGCLWALRLFVTIKAAKLVVVATIILFGGAFVILTADYGGKAAVKTIVPFGRETIEESRESRGMMVFQAESVSLALKPSELNDKAYAIFRDSNEQGTIIEFGFDELMPGSNAFMVNSMKVGSEVVMGEESSGDRPDPWVIAAGLGCCFVPVCLLGVWVVWSAKRLHRASSQSKHSQKKKW